MSGPGKPAGNLDVLCLLVSLTRNARTGDTPQLVEWDFSMAWMYILENADGSYYFGSTRNLDQRISQHQQGLGAKYTSNRLPVELVYGEEYDRVVDAYARDKQVQGWRGQSAKL